MDRLPPRCLSQLTCMPFMPAVCCPSSGRTVQEDLDTWDDLLRKRDCYTAPDGVEVVCRRADAALWASACLHTTCPIPGPPTPPAMGWCVTGCGQVLIPDRCITFLVGTCL